MKPEPKYTRKEMRMMSAKYRAEQRQAKKTTREMLRLVSLYPTRRRWCAKVAQLNRPRMVRSAQEMIDNLAALDLYAILCIVGRLTEWKKTRVAKSRRA